MDAVLNAYSARKMRLLCAVAIACVGAVWGGLGPGMHNAAAAKPEKLPEHSEADTEGKTAGNETSRLSETAKSGRVMKTGGRGPVYVVPVQGQVSKAQFLFLRRALKEAEAGDAAAVILDMDTPGGELQAAVEMVGALQSTKLPTITYVNRNAGSAGALIALATDRIYMTPVGAIGAAAPVMGGGQDLGEAMNDKVVSYFSKYFRSAAEHSGHNPEIAEAFINKEVEVEIGGKVISEKGSLLTLSPQEAVEVLEGRPVLASGIAETLSDVLKTDGLPAEMNRVEPTGMEVVAFYITLLAPLLLMLGIAGAYIEFKSPGFGVPGIVSALCFLLFFTGHWVAGLAGQEALVVFVLGLALVVAELIFFPGLIFPALLGVGLMLLAMLWAMVDRYPSDPIVPDLSSLVVPLRNLGISVLGGGLIAAFLAQFLPKTPFFRKIALETSLPGGASLPEPLPASEFASSGIEPGMTGRAESVLRPSGKAVIGDRYLDVSAVGEFIERGAKIRVVSVAGGQISVERA